MAQNGLTPVFSAFDEVQAEIVRVALEREGIDAVIENEHQAGLTGTLMIRLLVKSSDAERAKAFIAEHENGDAGEEE